MRATFNSALRGRFAPLLALAAIFLVTLPLYLRETVPPLNSFDQPFYLGIAHDLLDTGRFTDGYAFDRRPPGGERGPGMRFTPLFPSLLTLAAATDSGLRAGIDCLVRTDGKDQSCRAAAPWAHGAQYLELVAFFFLVWWLGAAAGGAETGWLALALALVTAPLLMRSVAYLMTEMTCLLLTTAAAASWVRSRSGSAAWMAAAGTLMGLATLTRPGFFYLTLVWALVSVAMILLRGRRPWASLAFPAGAAAMLVPWFLRNHALFGRWALTHGYDSHTLVQRIAFDTMTWPEYARSYLCFLPGGTAMGRQLIGPGACDRFGWDEQPTSFYTLGLRHMLDQTLAAAGGYDHHLAYLLRTYILPHPFWHLAVSIPLAMRGTTIAHWWGFLLLFPCLYLTVLRLRAGDFVYPAISLPPLFMLAFNASVAVNQVRYNLWLIPAFAIAGAIGLRAVASSWHIRRLLTKGGAWARTSPS